MRWNLPGSIRNDEGDVERRSVSSGAAGEKDKILAGIANVIDGSGY